MSFPKKYKAGKVKKKWIKRWKENDTFEYEHSEDAWVIDVPPAYPTGSYHIGNVLNYTYFDIMAKFWRMQGKDVVYPVGWDCHGLPIEVKVEEKHDIDPMKNRGKFRSLCKKYIRDNIKELREQSWKLGLCPEWDREYITMEPEYWGRVQRTFIKEWKKGNIYVDKHPLIYCPRCKTSIAEAEIEYEKRKTKLNYIEFPLVREGSITIATTRPELLGACVSIFVNPDDDRYQDLIGKKVRVPLFGQEVKIRADDYVDPEFGTGILMVCTYGDKEDVKLKHKYNLEEKIIIGKDGKMKAKGYEGLSIKEAQKAIIKDLRKEGYLKKQETIEQEVGKCWRCGTPVEIIPKEQFFFKLLDKKGEIKDYIRKIDWYPSYMEQRAIDWTDSLLWDWVLSRQRIWATPVPAWRCKECGKVLIADEEDVPVKPTQEKKYEKCPACGGEVEGVKDVLDTWFDSSISALITSKYFENEEEKWYPARLRSQGEDIIKFWAFYSVARCSSLTGEKPFEDALINGMVMGPDGRKMSKSVGNVVSPEELLEEYPVGAIRQWIAESLPGEDWPVDYDKLEYGQKFLIKLWNASRFVNTFLDKEMERNLLDVDRWVLTRLKRVKERIKEMMEEYQFGNALRTFREFFWHEFCDYYLEAIKGRVYQERDNYEGAVWTLNRVLESSLKVFAPICPFITEEIWHKIGNNYSIHRSEWKPLKTEWKEEGILEKGELFKELADKIRRKKKDMGISLSQEVKSLKIESEGEISGFEEMRGALKDMLRIKDLRVE